MRFHRFLIGIFFVSTTAIATPQSMKIIESDTPILNNKIIPPSILEEVTIALFHYPELNDTPIEFKFKDKIKKSFMLAQPKVFSLLKNRKNRAYIILISEKFTIEEEEFAVSELPTDVLIGWIGHELGHIMDYRERSSMNLIGFGIRYWLSSRFIKSAERAADTFAVNKGMSNYILATKDFILNHAHLSEVYKARIKRLYLSPEEILLLVDELHDLEKELD